MLRHIAIGDAYGAGFEFAEADVFARNDLSAYLPHPLYGMVARYTDDTQMTIAVAEAMLAAGEGLPTREMFADAFVAAFKRDPRPGYARKFHALLSEVSDGTQLIATIVPESARSGAAMRATPIGLYPDIDTVKAVAAVQAAVTHDTPDGIEAAQAAALATHFFRNTVGPKTYLREWLVAELGDFWATPHSGPVGELGLDAVNAAVTAIEGGIDLADILRRAVAFTGDVDTVAAVAMGAAYHAVDIGHHLPRNLFDDLEDGEYGSMYLGRLDRQLGHRFAPRDYGYKHNQRTSSAWCRLHYPGESLQKKLHSLVEEIGELAVEFDADPGDLAATLLASMARGKSGEPDAKGGEFGDAAMALFNLATDAGYDVLACLDAKHDKLRDRTPAESRARALAKADKGLPVMPGRR